MRNRVKQLFFYIFSFIIVAFAQPDWSQTACILASCVGYALFWNGISMSSSKKERFLTSLIWFSAVMALHLNWFFSDRYLGIYIYPFLVCFFVCFGIQFALINLFIHKELKIYEMLGISGGWALLEWSRLHWFSGCSWDPVGLELTASDLGMQMVSIIGIYGLSFWVFFTNLLALRLFRQFSWRHSLVWVVIAATPYLFGSVHLQLHSSGMKNDHRKPFSALLVQTAILPEEKVSLNGSKALSPIEQWEKILTLLRPHLNTEKPADVILLPEGAVPYGTDYPIYFVENAIKTFESYFEGVAFTEAMTGQRVGNRFWAQELANISTSAVVLGLETLDPWHPNSAAYNSAFLFQPDNGAGSRYNKRILVPMGEYIPFNWCKKILSKYGISDSFTAGTKPGIFPINGTHAGLSICYEETFGHLMRETKKAGAELLINLSNDVWMPRSRLATVHFLHGKLRSVELGLPALRCCNTGVTCGIDALGRVIRQLPPESKKVNSLPAVLRVEVPLYHYTTLYSQYGDFLILGISSVLFGFFCVFLIFRRYSIFLAKN